MADDDPDEGWWPEERLIDLIVPEVEMVERSVLGTILGPDGEPLITMLDRPWVATGFQVPS